MVAELFAVHVSVPELVLRGTLVYWLLFLIFRFVLRRDVGAVGIADILLLVIVADAAQNAMAGGYDTFAEGAILVGTIVTWNWLLDVLGFYFKPMRRFTSPDRLILVSHGVAQRRNLRREFISMDELEEKMREQGIENLHDVKVAYLEGDGQISVIRNSPAQGQKSAKKMPGR
ncbi:MAG TPA: YetF domain-containing protein [Steroidobacteraceae bacterium]|nr:YetF domain-containing protein [Steroidobacteraceae bacterium]